MRILTSWSSSTDVDARIETECEARLAAGQMLVGCFAAHSSIALIFQSNPPSVVNDDHPLAANKNAVL